MSPWAAPVNQLLVGTDIMKRLLLAGALAVFFALPGFALATSGVLAATPASNLGQSAILAHSATLPVAQTHCPNYKNGPNCVVVPPSGVVNNIICGVHFVGTAEPGTTIECTILPLLVQLPCSSTVLPKTGGAVGLVPGDAARAFRADATYSSSTSTVTAAKSTTVCCETGVSISIHGTDLHLKVPGARIFKFNPATGQSTLVSAITGTGGEYTIVFGSCPVTTVSLPKTGGVESGQFVGSISTPAGPALPLLPLLPVALLALGGAVYTLRNTRPRI